MSVQVSIFPYMTPDEWVMPPTGRTVLDWINFFPTLPADLRAQYIMPWYQDRLFFCKWYNYAVFKANEIVGPNNMERKEQLVKSLLPENWRFVHLRQFTCLESNVIREEIAHAQNSPTNSAV